MQTKKIPHALLNFGGLYVNPTFLEQNQTTVNKDVSQMPSQAGESEVPAASTSKPGLYTGAWDSDNAWESQRVYHDLTEISFQQLDRIGAQPRNEVQLEGKKVPFPAHLNLWFEN